MNQEIMKIAKSMKRPIVHVSDRYMLGVDTELYTISTIAIDSVIPRPFTTTINDYLDESKKEKYANNHPEIFFTEYSMIDEGFYINTWMEKTLYNGVMNTFHNLNTILTNSRLVYTESGLEKNPEFMNTVAKLKVDDGLTRYFIGGKYLITSFNKVHAINATDKVSIEVYDVDPYSILCKFKVDKKKYIIKEYIRYRKYSPF